MPSFGRDGGGIRPLNWQSEETVEKEHENKGLFYFILPTSSSFGLSAINVIVGGSV